MTKTLSDLPLETIEHIVDYLPNRDALLYLRQSSKDLCAKTLRQFSKVYFTNVEWRLNASNARAICHFSTRPLVVEHLASIELTAPASGGRSYDNFWKAKNINLTDLATALSRFSHLRDLKLVGFGSGNGHKDGGYFMHILVTHLATNRLEQLRLHDIALIEKDAVELVKKSHRKIKKFSLIRVDLIFKNSSAFAENEPYPPWSQLLLAMECFLNHCEVAIETPRVDGAHYFICPPWGTLDFSKYQWKGLTIEHLDNDDDDEPLALIHIADNSDWWEGIKRACIFAVAENIQYISPDKYFDWLSEYKFWRDFEQMDFSRHEKLRKLQSL
ncbi:hypothetical protein FKW77_004828 [Venturia effusa]|uniref:F-box domain-containing protein n=1 Tax=Venturia effusa TaxID=50376 RepID=A0A517L383_9PEZI|nr:hypothetical protein FKW77_004828 [Venturia effusa]